MDSFRDALPPISSGNGGLLSSGRGGGRGGGRGRGRGRGGAGRGGFSHTRGTGRGGYGHQSGPLRSADPRQRLSPSEMPAPSSAYLDVATKESSTVTLNQAGALEPLIIVFTLNHTLVSRSSASMQASRDPVKRPYLSTFLSYLFSASGDSEQGNNLARRKLKTAVFTGTRAHNVLSILKSIDLAAPARTTRFGEPYQVDPAEGDLLNLVLSCEDMDLGADYHNNVDTVKDLGRVWSKFGINEESGAERTVLMSDDAVDASAQPYSLLPIKTFEPNAQSGNRNDDELLAMIAQIDALCRETNVASFIRNGGLGQVAATTSGQGGTSSASTSAGSPADAHARLVEQGKKICETLGIPVRAAYDPNWRKAIGRKLEKAVPAWQRVSSQPNWSVSRGHEQEDDEDSDPQSS